MANVDLARWQFAFVTINHFFFVPITIGLAFLTALLQTAWYRGKRDEYLRLTRFFGTLLVINIAIGVVTGLVHVTSSSTFFLNPVELLAVLAVLAAIAAIWLVHSRSDGFAFAATTVTMAACIVSIFTGLYPNVMVSSTNAAYNLTVHNTASGAYSLKVMTVVVVVFLPFVLAYQTWTYYVFRRPAGGTGKLTQKAGHPDGPGHRWHLAAGARRGHRRAADHRDHPDSHHPPGAQQRGRVRGWLGAGAHHRRRSRPRHRQRGWGVERQWPVDGGVCDQAGARCLVPAPGGAAVAQPSRPG